ncbi:MAG: outer membrane beta-barrel protein [Methylocella sp.]
MIGAHLLTQTLLKKTLCRTALCLAFLGLASQVDVRAEDGAAVVQSQVALVATGGPDPDHGMPIEGWTFFPIFFAGGVFNDNIYNTASNRKSAFGLRLLPSFEASNDNGIYQTTLYGTLDAQIYPGAVESSSSFASSPPTTSANNIQGRAGFSHIYKPMEDLTFGVIFDYSRQIGLFGSGFGAGGPPIFVPNAIVPTGVPQYSNQLTGLVSVEKKITDRSFVELMGGVQGVSYQNPPNSPINFALPGAGAPMSAQQNEVVYTVSVRAGYWVVPAFYMFVEPGWAIHNYQIFRSDTAGYSIVSGIGSDQIGLWRGEIYSGYQRQSSVYGLFEAVSSPDFGARLYYYPTPYLTITAAADETLGSATPSVLPFPSVGSGTRTFQAELQGSYGFSPYWTASLQGGYGETNYAGLSRIDTAWTAGMGVSYTFWRNIALTFDYQFMRTDTNAGNGLGRYTQNLVTAGITYRY